MAQIEERLAKAVAGGALLESAKQNILVILNRDGCAEWERASIEELVERGEWTELNDRFYQNLRFGTGGLRGRTVGKVVTEAERGAGSAEIPQHPAVGTNTVNYFTIGTATRGLVSYLLSQFPGEELRVVIAYDTRLFSPEFGRLSADVIAEHGGTAYLFPDVRPTPELSFAVRRLNCHAGIVVTASHNPPHDNGYKVYFSDGAQIIEPHASAIIEAVRAAQQGDSAAGKSASGRVVEIDSSVDDDFAAALEKLVLRPDVIERQRSWLTVVYTPLHGTGVKIVPRLLDELGVRTLLVEDQAICDGRFPTVKSPNPENREALAMAVQLAADSGADAVIATDPDCDRMGVAVRNAAGEYEYLTGNQIASAIAQYRLGQLTAQQVLTPVNAAHAAIIKTVVTTDLLEAIASAHGIRCVETLTGFKYIGAKLKKYEDKAGGRRGLSAAAWRTELLAKSTYHVFGGEESYGYLAEDNVRDKDAAGSALMFVELVAFARSEGKTVLDLLADIYLQHGYYGERLGTLTFEGEQGAARIKRLLDSYIADPPKEWAGSRVVEFQNFDADEFIDADGDPIPRELMLRFRLADGSSVTTRASGTEPKIKYYFSAKAPVATKKDLAKVKADVDATLAALWEYTQADANRRADVE